MLCLCAAQTVYSPWWDPSSVGAEDVGVVTSCASECMAPTSVSLYLLLVCGRACKSFNDSNSACSEKIRLFNIMPSVLMAAFKSSRSFSTALQSRSFTSKSCRVTISCLRSSSKGEGICKSSACTSASQFCISVGVTVAPLPAGSGGN